MLNEITFHTNPTLIWMDFRWIRAVDFHIGFYFKTWMKSECIIFLSAQKYKSLRKIVHPKKSFHEINRERSICFLVDRKWWHELSKKLFIFYQKNCKYSFFPSRSGCHIVEYLCKVFHNYGNTSMFFFKKLQKMQIE